MRNCNKRKLLEKLEGVAERVAARGEKRRAYARYNRIRRKVVSGEISGYHELLTYLYDRGIHCMVEMAFGFWEVQIGTHPALIFDSNGSYAGRQFRYVTPTHKKVEGPELFPLTNKPEP